MKTMSVLQLSKEDYKKSPKIAEICAEIKVSQPSALMYNFAYNRINIEISDKTKDQCKKIENLVNSAKSQVKDSNDLVKELAGLQAKSKRSKADLDRILEIAVELAKS